MHPCAVLYAQLHRRKGTHFVHGVIGLAGYRESSAVIGSHRQSSAVMVSNRKSSGVTPLPLRHIFNGDVSIGNSLSQSVRGGDGMVFIFIVFQRETAYAAVCCFKIIIIVFE